LFGLVNIGTNSIETLAGMIVELAGMIVELADKKAGNSNELELGYNSCWEFLILLEKVAELELFF